MALPQSNAQQDTRKILEELQQKKQQLLKGGAPSLATSISATNLLNTQSILAGNDMHMINSAQRIALRNATSTSFGYFVVTDSSFGNQILPVLPRVDSE
uniref:Putative secreted protein n=1 Tax=Xenopsylla cheopis TaxID=163159 RepID=A0A6M2DDU7_XENCH